MKSKTLSWQSNSDVELLARALAAGAVAIGSTDTVIGLFASATQQGILQLNTIKKRDQKPYILLLPFTQKIQDLVEVPASIHIENLITRAWPGPLTLIFRAKQGVAHYLPAQDGTIAVRIPDHQGLQKLLAIAGPLFSTSANPSGQPAPHTLDAVAPEIRAQVDYFINHAREQHGEPGQSTSSHQASTVLDCTSSIPRMVREGAYDRALLEAIAGISFSRS